jgi:hypothetical protein
VKPEIGPKKFAMCLAAVASLLLVMLFPVASLHGPYCTVHGPVTDTSFEKIAFVGQLLAITICAVLRKRLSSAPTLRYAWVGQQPSAARDAHDRDLVTVHCAPQR